MSTMSLPQDASRLSAGLTGEVVLPGQPGFDDARQAFNLAADQEPAAVVFAGSARDVAAAITFALGGGVSFLGRKYGLSASNVRAIEVVTADGQLRRADREHEPDLFWALRGGGGSFGIVTALELRLFPVTQLYAGILWYPIERGPDVLHAWRDLTRGALPDELTTLGRFLRLPPVPELPAEIRGKSFALVEAFHLGDQAQADELLAPLRALRPVNDTIAAITVPELLHVHMDPEPPAASLGDGLMLSRLPDQAIDALVSTAGTNATFPLASVEVRHLGGELGRDRRDNGALGSLQAPYLMFAAGITPTPDLEAPARAQIGAVEDALVPWMAPHMYLNSSETARPRATLWTEPAYHRLRQIKARVDPDDVIRSNHPVPPAW